MEYSKFSVTDFVEDQFFRQWVQRPDARSEIFWKHFQEQNPSKTREINNARQLLLAIKDQVEGDFSTNSNEELVLQRIRERIDEHNETRMRRLVSWPLWGAAAAVVFLIGFWFTGRLSPELRVSYEANLEKAGTALIEKVNNTDHPIIITLTDRSAVFLKPNSKISFAENFNTSGKREIYLSGEAFFEVTKDPGKPFYVYANELITKVLGTSFNVSAFNDDKDVTIKVSTGRVTVAVTESAVKNRSSKSPEREGILLLPNQQAVFLRQEVTLLKSEINARELTAGKSRNQSVERFVFAATPAAEVFRVLEEAYGIQIEFDETLFAHCEFTANLSEESLYEKLDVICRSIEANYQVNDTGITINGKGCS